MDEDAIALAKGIRQTESGGDFNAKGASGESGAYQWTPATWKSHAKEALGNENAEMSPSNQNAVAYTIIKKRKDAGLNPAQIAAEWNSGSSTGWENKRGVNKYGVQFDVPKYVKSVTDAYQTIKKGGSVGVDPNNPSSVQRTPGLPSMPSAIMPGQEQGSTPGLPNLPKANMPQGVGDTYESEQTAAPKSFLKKVEDVISFVFPGQKIGEAIGTAIAKVGTDDKGREFIDKYEAGPTKMQVAGDIAQAGLTLASPLTGGAKTILGRIGTSAALGAGSGVASALTQGKRKVGDIATQGLVGGAVGAAAGGTVELLRKATQYLPYSVTRKYLPGTNPETAKYAVEKGLGAPEKMLSESEKRLSTIGDGIDKILNDPALSNVKVTAQEIYPQVLDNMPNAELSMGTLGSKLKTLIPNQKALITKLETVGLNAAEANQLKTALGHASYKTVFDDSVMKAGKEVGNAAYGSINEFLKNTIPAIRSDVPNIGPLFDEYTKEFQLQGALTKLLNRSEKASTVALPEILAGIEGFRQGGLGGGLISGILSKTIRSPGANLRVGGLLTKLAPKLASPTARTLTNVGIAPAVRGLTGLISK